MNNQEKKLWLTTNKHLLSSEEKLTLSWGYTVSINRLYDKYNPPKTPPVTTFNTSSGRTLGVKIGTDYLLSVEEAIILIADINKAIQSVVQANPVKH